MSSIDYYGKLFDGSTPITPAIARAANIAGAYGRGLVAAYTPVATGRLKSSWDLKLEGGGVRITNGTPYASFVENGTRKMSARSMVARAMPEIQDVFIDELYKEIGEAIGADVLQDFKKVSYESAATPNSRYPNLGSQATPKIKTGLSKRTTNTTKKFLFSNPRDILSKEQKAKVTQAKPLWQKRPI
jgi:HK97 gp10 family phage protein